MRTTLGALLWASLAVAAACGGGGTPAEPPAGSVALETREQAAPTTTTATAAQTQTLPPAQTAPAEAPAAKTAEPPAVSAAGTPASRSQAPPRSRSGASDPIASAPAPPAFTRTDLLAGTGAEATAGKPLTVHYTGWLYDPSASDKKGRVFDSSAGGSPITFVLGAGMVIPGWDQGFDGMKVGGKRRLIIPPALGYGDMGAGGGVIPPNTALIFEMELMSVGAP